jgi:hypothetical protein
MRTLSSDTLEMCHASPSPGAQEKSAGRAVCPLSEPEQTSTVSDGEVVYVYMRTSVHEQQLWRTILRIVGSLLDTNLSQIPDIDTSV